MKTLIFTRKVLAIFIMAICFLFSPKMIAQTIQIDSLFTTDGEIFPFGPNDTIYGLSISGSVTLLSDTSLVRVILTDNSGHEWMVYEAYPFISPRWEFEITEASDETMFRRIINPGSVKIQIINASLELDSAILQNRYRENLEILQENFKNAIELKKVDSLNHVIELNQMLWFAYRNPVSDLSYFDKSNRFGEKYNLLGLDYYIGGIFDGRPGVDGPADGSELVDSFDWRNRHGANDPSKATFYYNTASNTSGWLTPVENQSEIPICDSLWYIYGPLAAIEGVANIYFNYPMKNYNLSEQDVLDCDVATSDCHGGFDFVTNIFARDSGIVNEACYPRDNTHGNCRQNSPPNGSALNKIKIAGYHANYTYNADTIKVALINHGPLDVCVTNYNGGTHFMVLVGYGIVKAKDTLYNTSYPFDTIIVHDNSNYIGQLYWIFKNSWGSGYGAHGYFYHLANDVHIASATYYLLPIDDILSLIDTITPYDKDHDGYWNWGISERYDLPEGACSGLKDSDDSENRIGPFDSHYNGTPVKPEMEVTVGSWNPTPITNHGFYFMDNLNPQNIDIVISNPGNAQLNLAYITPVTIIDDGLIEFSLLGNQPEPKICMGNTTSFKVQFDPIPNEVNHSALVRIQLHQCDSDIYEDFEFEILYADCTFNTEAYPVTGFEPWDRYRVMNQDVFIVNGATLDITGSVAMNEESDIVVEAGGKLIVNGGLITGSCKTLWNGIDIWGNASQPQTLEFQGMVSVMNQGCIEYAETAIETVICPGCERPFPTGGIVSCYDAVFKDNLMDVKFYPYNNTHPVTHQLVPNISSFTKSIFETTEDLYKFNFGVPSAHIFMNQVGGISYTACSFGNYSAFHPGSRGVGIESYGAGYFVTYGCAQEGVSPCPTTSILPCRFENLDYGIRTFNNYGFYNINVSTAEFIHNRRGIYLGAVNNAAVIRNTFDISDPEHLQPNDTLVGLYLDAYTTGFLVEENNFTGPWTFSKTVGIHLLNTGTNQNEIYNNTFSTLKQGIMAVGTNRLSPIDLQDPGTGLCIKCNDFIDCNNDVWVTPVIINGISYPTQNTGIAQQQGELGNGSKTKAAGNTFSDVQTKNFENFDGSGHIDYTYHGFGTPPDYLIPNFYGDFTPIRDQAAQYSKSESCPSHLGGSITLSVEKNTLINETNLIEAYKDTLLMTIDGGNTEGLNYEVLTGFPEEALVIRQELMEKSPYLSDTVMISAIGKEEVLPGAMVRDILVSNPQAPKSKKIMNALDQRQDTIPDYMMDEIMQGLITFGAKELLEQKLGSHQAKKEKALTNINLFYKNDTANWYHGIDSLIALYENQNKLSDKYELAFLFLDKSDSTNAFGILNSIPGEFDLDEQELFVHDKYQELFEILWDTKNDSTGLDSLQIQDLLEMSSVSNSLPGILASNLLIKEGILIYNEPVYLGEEFIKTFDAPTKKTEIENEKSHLKLFPNPAGNYFIAQYDLREEQSPGVLKISDINGKELKALQLKDKQNQIVIPALEFTNGIYLIKLLAGNEILNTEKISINR